MMRKLLAYLLTLVVILAASFISSIQSQTCTSCPSGSPVTLTSTYSNTYSHQWTCTDGFSSTLQSPTFNPAADVTCSLVVTDESGCTASSQVTVDVCAACECDDACIGVDYDAVSDEVTFSDVGDLCDGFVSQTRQYKTRAAAAWTTIPVSNVISGCTIKEYLDATPTVTISGSNFSLNITGLTNYCSCIGDLEIDYVFAVLSSSAVYYPPCGTSSQSHTISPAAFASAGNVCDVYVKNLTNWGYVINQYRFTYNGAGLNVANVNVTTIAERVIYKPIYTKRVVTYDSCPSTTCETTTQLPQQPDDCSNAVSFITRINCVPCASYCLFSNSYNGNLLVSSRQWYYNGSPISPNGTSATLCMSGRPDGEYCVHTTFTDGCTVSACHIIQPACNLAVSIYESGTLLTTTITGCIGTPTYSWSRWNGSSWVSVGTNSASYDTGGLDGDYRVSVACSGPPACTNIATYTYVAPCAADVSVTVGASILTANVTGCGGASISYLWQRWTGTVWSTVRTNTTTSTTDDYTPTLSGLYRVQILCNGCPDEAQVTWTAPDQCTGFSITMTGPNGPLCNGTLYTYGRTITGGSSPFTQQWTRNGANVGTSPTFDFTPASTATHTLQVVVTDANGCTAAAQKIVSSQTCCGVSTTIAPTDPSDCIDGGVLFTTSPSGGTPPYSYAWTSTPPSQSWGSSPSADIYFPTPGVRTVNVQVTDANGCTATNSTTLTITACEDCTCTPSLTLTNPPCNLVMGSTGTGCGNFSYQLQYSLTGTGWSVVASGTASDGFSSNHSPAANGLYRLVLFSGSCTLRETSIVSVSCVTDCTCTPSTLVFDDCLLSWPAACTGWTKTLQYNSVDLTQENPWPPADNGNYRVRYSKSGCPDTFSNIVVVDTPACAAEFLGYFAPYGNVYCVQYDFPRLQNRVVAGNNTVRLRTNRCTTFGSSYVYGVAFGDGSPAYTGTGTQDVTHTYTDLGIYQVSLAQNSALGYMESDSYFYPSGNNPVPYIGLVPDCVYTAPVIHAKDGCQAKLWFNFSALGSDMVTANYVSHTFEINEVPYTLPITVISGAPDVQWQFKTPDATPIIISQDLLLGINTVDLYVTINGGTQLWLRGYFRLCNEDCFTP